MNMNKYVMTINPREDEVNNMSYMDKIALDRNRKNALRLDRRLRRKALVISILKNKIKKIELTYKGI